MYFDDFKNRVQSNGISESDALKNSSVAFINRTFANSPNYKIVKVDGIDTPSRIINTDTFKEYNMILLPDTIVLLGSLVEFDSTSFLVMDFMKGNIISNAKLTTTVGKIKWYDKDNILHEYYITGFTANKFQVRTGFNNIGVNLASDYMNVFLKRDSITDTIVPSQRFIIGGKSYSTLGIDNITAGDSNNGGLTQLTITITVEHPDDDFINGIADNSLLNEKNSQNIVEGGTGVVLW